MSASVEKLLSDAIQLHQQDRLKKADALYQKILSRQPRYAEALHMRGVLKFQQGHYDYADQLLSDAQKLDSDNPWIHYHRGDLYRTKGEFIAAEKCFKQALALGATDSDVYFMLANTQFEQERFTDALENYLVAVNSPVNDPDYRLNLANCYEMLEEPEKATQQLSIIAKDSNDQTIHLQLIDVLTRIGKFLEVSERISNLPSSVQVDTSLLVQTVSALLNADRAEDASRLLDIVDALDLTAESHETLASMTGVLVNVGRYQDARKLLEITHSRYEPDAAAWFRLGLCEQTSGAFEEAAQCHRRALKCDPTFGRAAYSLAINGKSAVTDDEVNQWRKQASDEGSTDEEKIHFNFAVARTLDAKGEIGQAFEAFQKANDSHHASDPFDPDQWDSYIDSIIEIFSPAYLEKFTSNVSGGTGLVFIVGMPRSGSTLLEHQLTRRFDAAALGEHPTARRLFMDLPRITGQNRSVAESAQYLTANHIQYLKKQYLDSISLHTQHTESLTDCSGQDGNVFYVDKLLGNFVRLGMLAVMFPDARILHCVRDAEATCVSCYTNLFARGLKFTYDLYGLGRAWSSYRRLMDHWQQVLPLSLYNVQYEQVVTQPEKVFSEISEFLGTQSNVSDSVSDSTTINTASFYQARQPISTASLEGWKRFEQHLDPMMRGLGR